MVEENAVNQTNFGISTRGGSLKLDVAKQEKLFKLALSFIGSGDLRHGP